MIIEEEERLRLTIPLSEAVAFALGWSNLEYEAPLDVQRQLIGLLAIDELEYSEQWRTAAMLRACLMEKWQDLGR